MSSSRYPAPGSAPTRDAADPRVVGLADSVIAQLHHAARCIRDGDAANAQSTLMRLIADTREHPEALRLFGLLQLRQRRATEAVASLLGFELINKVPSTLHTPLMSGSNAISGIIVLGALLQVGSSSKIVVLLAAVSILIASINIVGGFLVTRRMLAMFQKS